MNELTKSEIVEQKNGYNSSQEQEIIEQAQRGDSSAFAKLVKMYSGRIYSLAIRIMRNEEDAEDVLQETFLIMMRKINQYSGRSSFYTWLYRVSTNVALGKIREKKRSEKNVSIDEPDFTVIRGSQLSEWPDHLEQKLEDGAFRECLTKAVDALPANYRTVFVLRDLENLSTKETSETLKISEANVKVRLMRARLFLRDQLARHLKCMEGTDYE